MPPLGVGSEVEQILSLSVASRSRSSRRPTPGVRAALSRSGPRRVSWLILWIWDAIWALVHTPGGGYSWHYFDLAARLITGSGPSAGLHVYAAHPELQMGPLAMLAAVPLRAIDPALSYVLAPALLTLTGPALLAMLVRAREGAHGRISPTMLLLTGLFALPVWTEVTTHYAHLDDVLAMALGLAALVSSRRNAPVMTGVLLAGAVDAKPWALGFCAVLLALTPRARVVAGLVAAAGIMVVWLPFLLADPGTLSLTHFTIDNVDDSSLRALGVSSSATPPWDRPAQALLGAAAAAAAIRRGRWPLALLMVLAVRLLLDPETYPYYSSTLVLAAAAADLLTGHRRLPLWTAAGASWYAANELLLPFAPAEGLGFLRAAFCLALVGAALIPLQTDTKVAPGDVAPEVAAVKSRDVVRDDLDGVRVVRT